MAAWGHGRSYGATRRVLGRSLPGILECDLWSDLANRDQLPAAAFLTDIGNDLLYDVTPEQLIKWVAQCLEQLRPHVQRLAISQLPEEKIKKIGKRQFAVLRSILFPKSKLPYDVALERVEQVNTMLRAFAGEYSAYIMRPLEPWYGADPIHIRRRDYPAAWQRYFAAWCDGQMPRAGAAEWAKWWRFRRIKPQKQAWFGFWNSYAQPFLTLENGTRISSY